MNRSYINTSFKNNTNFVIFIFIEVYILEIIRFDGMWSSKVRRRYKITKLGVFFVISGIQNAA